MSDSLESLRRQLGAAGDLKSVVRAMKALAASSLGQYEKAAVSLKDYYRTVELGLNACLKQSRTNLFATQKSPANPALGIVIFGSDQGLVGQFNEVIAQFLQSKVPSSRKPRIWAIGERVAVAIEERGFNDLQRFDLPNSIQGITPLVGRILVAIQDFQQKSGTLELHVFHHRPHSGETYEPIGKQLLPVNKEWSKSIKCIKWATNQIPQTIGPTLPNFSALLREYIFVSLFRACAESLASENASRLVGMQRAEKNIEELSGELTKRFHRLRQSTIDEELFDVVSGFEALTPQRHRTAGH
jgi:F-type H+-transporting ATPase subunit gamma